MSRIGLLDIGVGGTTIVADAANSKQLQRIYTETTSNSKNQAYVDNLISLALANPVNVTGFFNNQMNILVSGIASPTSTRADLKQSMVAYNTNGVSTGLKYYIKITTRYYYYIREISGTNYYYTYEIPPSSLVFRIAKGTWVGVPGASDWDNYDAATTIDFNLNDRHHFTQNIVNDGSSTFNTMEINNLHDKDYMEIPESWINFTGLTKIAFFFKLSPTPFRISDAIPTGIVPTGERLNINYDYIPEHLAIGAMI